MDDFKELIESTSLSDTSGKFGLDAETLSRVYKFEDMYLSKSDKIHLVKSLKYAFHMCRDFNKKKRATYCREIVYRSISIVKEMTMLREKHLNFSKFLSKYTIEADLLSPRNTLLRCSRKGLIESVNKKLELSLLKSLIAVVMIYDKRDRGLGTVHITTRLLTKIEKFGLSEHISFN